MILRYATNHGQSPKDFVRTRGERPPCVSPIGTRKLRPLVDPLHSGVSLLIRIRVDPARCIGSGQCVRTVPGVFDQREEDGIVVLLDANPAGALVERVRKAARLCPSQSIRIEET
ncbi:MAG: ferredoxin [Burkholderiales bacterium]